MLFSLSLPQLFVLIGLLLILAELFVGIETGFDLVLIGTILILGGAAGIFTASLSLALAVASGLALVYVVFGRRLVRQKFTALSHKTNVDRLIGKSGVVIRSITPDTAGLVRLDDEDWRASAAQVLYEKDKVIVKAVSGVTLTVEKLPQPRQ